MTRYKKDRDATSSKKYTLKGFQGRGEIQVTPRNFVLEVYSSGEEPNSLGMHYCHRLLFHENGEPPVEIARGKRNVLWRLVLGSDEMLVSQDLVAKTRGVLPKELIEDVIFLTYSGNKHI